MTVSVTVCHCDRPQPNSVFFLCASLCARTYILLPDVRWLLGAPRNPSRAEAEMMRHTESHFGGPAAAAAPVRRVARVVRAQTRAPDMADYYQGEGGGCFGRGSSVMVLRHGNNGSSGSNNNNIDGDGCGFVKTDVNAVRAGDVLAVCGGGGGGGGGGAEVACVITIAEPHGARLCELPSGLRITSNHPIRIDGTWQPPVLRPEAQTVTNSDGWVVNFVLRGADGCTHDHGLSLLVSGIECAVWGHGLKEAGVCHEFYGSRQVLDALTVARPDWEVTGRAVVHGLRS